MTCNIVGLRLNADKNLISKSTKTERIVEIEVKAPTPHVEHTRPSLNLALVLDRSGSMAGEKLEYVKQAACHVLDQMNERDQVSLVVYDDSIQVIAHSMKVTNGNRFELKRIASSIRSGSMTNLAGGWLAGCREIAASAQDGTVNRTMLLTDGLANVGETDPEVLAAHALEIYKDSISTSTFGVGEGFNENLLEGMSNRGGGNFYYIAKPSQIPEIFLKEFTDLVGITARKVEIKLVLPPTVEYQVLGGWTSEYKDGNLRIFLGDMLSGKTQNVYLKLQIPGDEVRGELSFSAKAFGQGISKEVLEGQATVVFEYADQKEVDEAPLDQGLMERFGMVDMADAATQALILERKGERQAARVAMQESINRHRGHVSPQTSRNYESLSERMEEGMTEVDRKRAHWESYNLKRQKEQKLDSKEDEK